MDVINYDLNLALWEHLLSKEYIESRCYRPELFKAAPCFLASKVSRKGFDALQKGIVEEIDTAISIFRDEAQFHDLRKLNWAVYVIFKVQQLVYYQYSTFIGFKSIFWPGIGFKVKSMHQIYDLGRDAERNPLLDLMEKIAIPEIARHRPAVIGVEITFPWEIVQALTLNLLIKKHMPDVHITYLGHGFDEFNFNRLINRLNEQRFFFGFDSIFMARNDQQIHALFSMDTFEPEALANVGSLAFRNNGAAQINQPINEGEIDFSIVPDYNDLPLNHYMIPVPVLIDKLSSKCFWSQCAYCSINAYKSKQQVADIDIFINRLETYHHKYGCRHIWLLDEAVPPHVIEKFSDHLIKRGSNMIWSVRTRINEKLSDQLLEKMYAAGCRELWIGFETASPRLLALMNKTKKPKTYTQTTKQIMATCNRLGIGLHFCILMGFPNERQEDLDMTLGFFKAVQPLIKRVPFFATFNEFWLMKDSAVYHHPKKYGIDEIIQNEDNYDMVDVPYTMASENHADVKNARIYKSTTEKTSEKLAGLFVKNKSLLLLWFCAQDSPYELLLKEKNQNTNPFQLKINLWEMLLLIAIMKFGSLPIVSRMLCRLLRRYAGVNDMF